MKFKKHTILQLIGPSCCGKSTFAHDIAFTIDYYKEKIDPKYKRRVEIVSSDDERRYLIGVDLDKHNDDMMYASHHAFQLLKNKVDYLSSYPINRDLIIVDSTGLSESFRKEIKEIAKKNHYYLDCVVFRYDDKSLYYKNLGSDDKEWVVSKHVRKLLEESSHIRSRDYNQRYIQKNLDFPTEFEIVEEARKKYIEGKCLIVSDVHGMIDQLAHLLEKSGWTSYDHVILIGDLIDKSPGSEKVLDFLLSNIDMLENGRLLIIKGNHDSFVHKYFHGEVELKSEFADYFSSCSLKGSFSEKLDQVMEYALDFIEHDKFIVTHSPCSREFLLKESPTALKMQRNMRHSHLSSEEVVKKIEEMYDYPIYVKKHIYGHISFEKPYVTKNCIGIDTGCVHGGMLTAVDMTDKPRFIQVPGEKYFDGELIKIKEKEVNLDHLDRRETRIIKSYVNNKVNFISGTVSPSDKL